MVVCKVEPPECVSGSIGLIRRPTLGKYPTSDIFNFDKCCSRFFPLFTSLLEFLSKILCTILFRFSSNAPHTPLWEVHLAVVCHTPLYTHFGRFYCIWNAIEVNIFMAFDNTLVQLVVIMILSNQNGILRKSRAFMHPFSILR